MTDAVTAQGVAQQNVADATTAAAQQQITNQDNIAQAQKKSAQSIADAERALTQALDNQKSAFERAAIPVSSGSSAINTYANDLAKLTPAGRSFVEFVTGTMYPVFEGLKAKVQDSFLPLIQTGLTDLLPFFRDLGPFIVQAGAGIGQTFVELAKFIGSKTGLSEVMTIFKDGNGIMASMGGNFVTLFEAFTGVGAQAGLIVTAIGDGMTNLVDAFAKWVSDGGFQKFLAWLKENGPSLVADIGDFFKAAGSLLVALAPIGVVIDDIIGYISQLVTWVSSAWERFSEWAIVIGGAAAAITALLSGPIALIIAGIALVVVGVVDLVVHWRDVWAEIKTLASDAWSFLDQNLFQPIGNFFTKTIPSAFDDVVGFFKALPSRVIGALGDFVGKVWSVLALPVTWLADHVGTPILNFFKAIPSDIVTAAKGMWDGISDAFKDALNTIIGWWDDLKFKIPGFSIGPVHFGGFTLEVPQIPKFHDGGVVQGTPGVEQLALLMPGEIVTPAGMALPTGAGSNNLALHLEIHGADLSNVKAFEDVVVAAFTQFGNELQPRSHS